jgi:NAD(P)-dependent dehydrogenase (short-subunit alcohol dehydrogenase family)
MKPLAGKIALVTGASRGIGRSIALALARDGAFVIVHYGAAQDLAEAVLAEIDGAGGAGCIAGADLGTPEGVATLVAAVTEELSERGLPPVDILVNNAGIGLSATLMTVTPETFDRVFAVNAKAPLFLAQAFAEPMPAGGRIINITSVVAQLAFGGGNIAYGATKAALDYMTVSMAALLGPRGITVNSVVPGATATDFMGDAMQNEQFVKAMASIAALNAVGQPGDIAEVVAFVASPAAKWMTGSRVVASGGTQL